MAGEVARRRWYLVIRRGGVITQRIEVRITPATGEPELDPFVGPIYRDFEVFPNGDGIDVVPADPSIFAEFELVSTTQPWEIAHLE